MEEGICFIKTFRDICAKNMANAFPKFVLTADFPVQTVMVNAELVDVPIAENVVQVSI